MDKFKLQTGDIISCYTPFQKKKPSTYLAPIIRLFTQYKYTHNAIAIECWDQIFICEAYTSGIIIRPLKDFAGGMKITVSRPRFEFDKKSLAIKALSNVSTTKYDLLSLGFYQIIYQITGKWHGATDERKAAKKFYCSEYIAWLYKDVFKEWFMTTPENIHKNTKDFVHVFEGEDHNLVHDSH